jgi:ERCC4-related helicase
MPEIRFSAAQSELVEQPLNLRTFLMSPAGAGKTTAAVMRLLYLLDAGVPGTSILIQVPQRNLVSQPPRVGWFPF